MRLGCPRATCQRGKLVPTQHARVVRSAAAAVDKDGAVLHPPAVVPDCIIPERKGLAAREIGVGEAEPLAAGVTLLGAAVVVIRARSNVGVTDQRACWLQPKSAQAQPADVFAGGLGPTGACAVWGRRTRVAERHRQRRDFIRACRRGHRSRLGISIFAMQPVLYYSSAPACRALLYLTSSRFPPGCTRPPTRSPAAPPPPGGPHAAAGGHGRFGIWQRGTISASRRWIQSHTIYVNAESQSQHAAACWAARGRT